MTILLRTLILAFCSITALSYAGGYTHLPREVGPFKLGMSTQDFQRITGISAEPCPICIKDEAYATLDNLTAHKHIRDVRVGDGVDFFFYQDKLYHISISPAARDLFEAQQEFTAMFGNDGKQENRDNGTTEMRWEDGPTILTLNYRTDLNEAFAVNYYDLENKEARDFQEILQFGLNNGLAAQ